MESMTFPPKNEREGKNAYRSLQYKVRRRSLCRHVRRVDSKGTGMDDLSLRVFNGCLKGGVDDVAHVEHARLSSSGDFVAGQPSNKIGGALNPKV